MPEMTTGWESDALRRAFGAIAVVVFAASAPATGFCMALGVAELAVRIVDGYRLTSFRLELTSDQLRRVDSGPRSVSRKWVDAADAVPSVRKLPVAAGVDREWFASPMPERPSVQPDPDLVARMNKYKSGADERAIYEWNRQVVIGAVCRGEPARFSGIFDQFDDVFVFDPTDGSNEPPIRFLQHATHPDGMRTTAFGWRGPDIPLTKPPGTIRIAFVGASTTVSPHAETYSYPELVGLWLNRWANVNHPGISVEVINAGREGINSRSLPAILRQEILPVEPDLVYYDYDGANQFWPGDFVGTAVPPRPAVSEPRQSGWTSYSAVGRRLVSAIRQAIEPGSEPPKPHLNLRWPIDLDERDPDLKNPELPIQLPELLGDIEVARREAAPEGAAFVLTSIAWLVYHGMVLDPARDANVFSFLNTMYWPFTYAHMRRYLDFKTRVFRKYAAAHGLDFVDVDAAYPLDPRLFDDGIHMTRAGIRLHAWIVFNGLVPIIERRLVSHEWPRAARRLLSVHPAFPGHRRLVPMTEIRGACTEGHGRSSPK
jgi:hypothetical protein